MIIKPPMWGPINAGTVDPKYRQFWRGRLIAVVPWQPADTVPIIGTYPMPAGTIYTDTTTWTTTPRGPAILCTDTDAQTGVDLGAPPNAFGFRVADRWAVAVLFSISSTTGDERALISRFGNSALTRQFMINTLNETAPADLRFVNDAAVQFLISDIVELNTTYLLAAWCDGNQKGYMRLYDVDAGGVLVGANSGSIGGDVSQPFGANLILGGRDATIGGDEMVGSIELCYMWDGWHPTNAQWGLLAANSLGPVTRSLGVLPYDVAGHRTRTLGSHG